MRSERIDVVAAVIGRKGRYLLGRRPEDKRHGGRWEFPGGKLRDQETFLDAARRELREELGLVAASMGRQLGAIHDDGSPFTVHFVEIVAVGEPVAREHAEVGWFTPDEMASMELAPADSSFVDQLPAIDPEGGADTA